jgi:hypothetical protein
MINELINDMVDAGVHHIIDEFVDHGFCGFPP